MEVAQAWWFAQLQPTEAHLVTVCVRRCDGPEPTLVVRRQPLAL